MPTYQRETIWLIMIELFPWYIKETYALCECDFCSDRCHKIDRSLLMLFSQQSFLFKHFTFFWSQFFGRTAGVQEGRPFDAVFVAFDHSRSRFLQGGKNEQKRLSIINTLGDDVT